LQGRVGHRVIGGVPECRPSGQVPTQRVQAVEERRAASLLGIQRSKPGVALPGGHRARGQRSTDGVGTLRQRVPHWQPQRCKQGRGDGFDGRRGHTHHRRIRH
jgi:hypothetical protein